MPQTKADEAIAERAGVLPSARPLFVDLDGTLVKSDTLVDSVLLLARKDPAMLVKIPGWLRHGKAAFKARVIEAVALDVAHLPYNRALLHYLHQQHAEGRKLHLATGADGGLARRVAAHLGIFEQVHASDGNINLTGKDKLDRLRRNFPSGDFGYIGNASPDLPLLLAAAEPMVANPDGSLRRLLHRHHVKAHNQFEDRVSPLRSFGKGDSAASVGEEPAAVCFPCCWGNKFHVEALLRTAIAFLCFSLCASATYIVNDLLDLDADRRHHKKRNRPFAAGDLSAVTGVGIVAIFLVAGFAGGWWLSTTFSGLAADLFRDNAGVFAGSEAGCAAGRSLAFGTLYAADAGGCGGDEHGNFALAGRLFAVPVSVAGDGQAVQRVAELAGRARVMFPTMGAVM